MKLNGLLIAFLILFTIKLSAQAPLLLVYCDGKPSSLVGKKLQVSAKVGKKYLSILNGKKEIVLNPDILLQDIEAFRFIIEKDTAVFYVSKIFEDMKNQRGKNRLDEMYVLFNELKAWEIHMDSFPYFFCQQFEINQSNMASVKTPFTNFRVFALRTSTFKYYLAPPKNGA